jgi:hypothetical protein
MSIKVLIKRQNAPISAIDAAYLDVRSNSGQGEVIFPMHYRFPHVNSKITNRNYLSLNQS